MKTLMLDYQGMGITASRDAWFNATQIAALFDKQPYEWLRLPETERYIQALCKREAEKQLESDAGKSRITNSHFIKTKKGNSKNFQQGTWLHPKLAIAFARWCDVDFSVWCDEQIEALLLDGKYWQAARDDSRIAFKIMSEVLQSARQAEGKITEPYHYVNEALLCNAALTGKFNPLERDTLPKAALTMLTRLEARNAALIGHGADYETRKGILFALAAPVRAGFQAALEGVAA